MAKKIPGKWVVIDRQYLALPWPDSGPFGKTIEDFPVVRFDEDGSSFIHYDWPRDATYPWKLIDYHDGKAFSWQFACHQNSYVLDHNAILYYDNELILTRCYILIAVDAKHKYKTVKDLMGLFSILHTSASFYIENKRNELLNKLGSKPKVNEYIEFHKDELLFRLMPPYKLFWDKIKSLF